MGNTELASLDLTFRARGLVKQYPGVRAIDEVDLEVAPGRIHALLGENGAGKSTLVKTMMGLVRPDEGEMWLRGAPYTPANPRAARAAGVAMVFQHFSQFDALTVAENIALGLDDGASPRALLPRIEELSKQLGLPLQPDRRAGTLSAGERQRLEIIRCLMGSPQLLIMDEPTSVLTPQEADILFATLRRLADQGVAILYISHRLDEIRSHCDHATVLRHGRVVGDLDPRTHSAEELARRMVGGETETAVRPSRPAGDPVLEITGLSLPPPPEGMALSDISLTLRAGEVFGIGGVAGNGQGELLAALAGEVLSRPGAISLNGVDLSGMGPQARRAEGLATAPEDRLGHAAVPVMTLAENTLLSAAPQTKLVERGLIRHKAAAAFARKVIAEFDVRTRNERAAAGSLSGGNLQKFVIGREILQNPRVLVVNQPSWGVDAGAAAAIRRALVRLAENGAGVIVISQDLDELLEISDRFAALEGGRLSEPVPTDGLTQEAIGLMLGGAHGMAPVDGVRT